MHQITFAYICCLFCVRAKARGVQLWVVCGTAQLRCRPQPTRVWGCHSLRAFWLPHPALSARQWYACWCFLHTFWLPHSALSARQRLHTDVTNVNIVHACVQLTTMRWVAAVVKPLCALSSKPKECLANVTDCYWNCNDILEQVLVSNSPNREKKCLLPEHDRLDACESYTAWTR